MEGAGRRGGGGKREKERERMGRRDRKGWGTGGDGAEERKRTEGSIVKIRARRFRVRSPPPILAAMAGFCFWLTNRGKRYSAQQQANKEYRLVGYMIRIAGYLVCLLASARRRVVTMIFTDPPRSAGSQAKELITKYLWLRHVFLITIFRLIPSPRWYRVYTYIYEGANTTSAFLFPGGETYRTLRERGLQKQLALRLPWLARQALSDPSRFEQAGQAGHLP